MEVERTAALASPHREVVGFAWRIVVLEDKLVEVHQARDTTEVNSQGLSDVAANVERRQEDFEMECQERIQELTLLQTRGSELCKAIVSPLRVWSHLSEGMRIATLHHVSLGE
jgi:hypothetical protein